MRTIFLFPLTALLAVAAGCGSEGREQATRSTPQRDLTLVTQSAGVGIASPVETQQLRIHHRTIRQASRSNREPKIILAAVASSAPALAVPEPVAQPASTEATAANDRELLPGKTVTVIPASSAPSTGSDTADEPPPEQGRTMVARGGGTCRGRGRGPGIGMAPAPRPDFR
jgi:hypothetical protein